MKTQIVMLPQPILVSANALEGINPKVTYFDDKVDSNGIYRGVEFGTNKPIYNIILGINENRRVVKEIIAGIPELPSIDFSSLSEEDRKKIGWVDVEKLADDYSIEVYPINGESREIVDYIESQKIVLHQGFVSGFKAAQSLNKEKYSEEDMKKAMEYGMYKMKYHTEEAHKNFIQSLSQPKVFDVEVEMEYLNQNDKWSIYYPFASSAKEVRPKITNNSIKVIKVL